MRELVDAALMAPAGEIGAEKGSDAGPGHVVADEAGAKREGVGIVMFAGEARGERIVHPRTTAAKVAVGRDRNADARAADGDAPLGPAAGDLFAKPGAIFGIIDAFRTVGAEVDDLVTGFAEPHGERVLQFISGVVGGKGNAHGQ